MARIPAVQNRLGLDDGELGLSLLSLSFGAILAMPTTGWLIQRWGNPLVLRVAAAGLCLALPLLPLAPTMPLLMLSLFVFGIAFGLFDVAMNVQAVAIEQRHGLTDHVVVSRRVQRRGPAGRGQRRGGRWARAWSRSRTCWSSRSCCSC